MFAGLLLTLAHDLVLIVAGMAVFTFGFFASHSIASSWVGRRARTQQALASALYLCCYYLGSSVVGWLCGVLWERGGWSGVVTLLGVFLGAALAIALRLRRLAPVAPALAPA
jgi:YNFM family putative membrane transporter